MVTTTAPLSPITGPIRIASVAPGLLAANANGQGPATGFLLSVPQQGGQSYEPLARFDEQRKRFVTRPILLNRQTVQAERLFFVLYGTGIRGRERLAALCRRRRNGLRFADNAQNWSRADNGLPLQTSGINNLAASGSSSVGISFFGGLFSSGDLGKSWQSVEGLPASIVAMGASGSALFVSIYDLDPNAISLYRSTDLGKTWTPAGNGISPAMPRRFASLGANLFAADDARVFVTTNNGESWSVVTSGLPEKTYITALAASGSKVYAGTSGKGVYVSANNGQNWAPANGFLPPNANITSLFSAGSNLFAVAFDDSNTSCPNGGVLIEGRCYGSITPVIGVGGGFGFGGLGLGFNNGTVYLSPNQGRGWAPIMAGLRDARPLSFGANGANVFARTAGQSVFLRQF